MIQLLTGENDFAIKAAVRERRREFAAMQGVDAVVIRDGQQLSVPELPQLFAGQSLFSPQQLIIVSDVASNKLVWEVLPEQLDVDDPELVLVETKPDKRTRTYKWLQKHATIREYGHLSDVDLQQWLLTTANQAGINIAPDVARFLVSYAGADQWRLTQEVAKLALSDRPITQQLIQDIIDPNPEASAFALLDAAVAGRQQEMERLLAIISIDEDPYRFVGLLTSQVYALALCASAGDRPSATIAKDGGIHPFVASKAQASARRLSKPKLGMIIDAIAELDATLKSTGGDPWLSVRVCLHKIAA